jgi:SSS family solute:Na+ symporter
LYHGAITLQQYNASVAPIQAKHGWMFDFWNIHWLYYTQILFLVTAVLLIALSYLTQPPPADTVRFTWYGATAQEKEATRASWGGTDVALSVVVLVAVAVFYWAFW